MKALTHQARRVLGTTIVLTVLSASALAADHLKLKNGRTLVGAATAYDREANVLTFITDAGERMEIAAADLDRTSAYKLAKSKATKGSAEDELKLGNFACEIELYAHANRHYGNAEKLDPKLAPQVTEARAKLRDQAAEYCMNQAREALSKNDKHEAETWLTKIVEKLPGTPQAEQAASMLGQTYAENHAAKDDHLEAAHGPLLEKELKTGKKHYDSMLESIQKGLTNTRSSSVARREFERAWKSGERTLKELDKVEKELAPEIPEVPALFDGYRELVTEHMVAAQLHLASLLTVQSSYKEALKAVQLALSVDPKNRDALAARARIEEASSRGWRW